MRSPATSSTNAHKGGWTEACISMCGDARVKTHLCMHDGASKEPGNTWHEHAQTRSSQPEPYSDDGPELVLAIIW
eukprot:scaffold115179_cov16-Tisochrysis_lutea.AAC.1